MNKSQLCMHTDYKSKSCKKSLQSHISNHTPTACYCMHRSSDVTIMELIVIIPKMREIADGVPTRRERLTLMFPNQKLCLPSISTPSIRLTLCLQPLRHTLTYISHASSATCCTVCRSVPSVSRRHTCVKHKRFQPHKPTRERHMLHTPSVAAETR